MARTPTRSLRGGVKAIGQPDQLEGAGLAVAAKVKGGATHAARMRHHAVNRGAPKEQRKL